MIRGSIIIVTYGQRALVEQCLGSVESALGARLGADWELVIIDNASPDDTPALLGGWADRATVRRLERNRDFAGGCNDGAALARGEVLVFLNSDTVVGPGALEALVDQALEPGVGAAGCRLLFPDGTLQHAGVAFLDHRGLGAAMPQHVFHGQDGELAAARGVFECDCVTAACLAVRADVFRAIGGFDEGFRNGLEDVDLCLRIRVHGERIVYRGDVTVVHHEGASRGSGAGLWATPEKLAAMRHNDLRLIGRWGAHLDQDDDLAERLWDAVLEHQPPERTAPGADLVVVGQPGGIGPAADEARALMAVLAAHGRVPCAVDAPAAIVRPRLDGPMAALLAQARTRAPNPDADWLFVPGGEHDGPQLPAGAIIRLAGARAAVPLEPAAAVWVAAPSVAAELIDRGLPAARIRVVPPPILPASPGAGGAGILAVLPVHDPAAARAILDALRRLGASVPIRLLPTAPRRDLAAAIADALPGAELLAPCSDEQRFARLAAGADLLLAADATDRFERRALVAAGVGTPPLIARPAGPAAAILGAEAAGVLDGDPGAVATAVATALDRRPDRAELARRVGDACGPDALPRHLAADPASVAGPPAHGSRDRSPQPDTDGVHA